MTPETIITSERLGDLIRCRFCDAPASDYPGVYKCDSVSQNGIALEHMRGMRCIRNERDTLRARVKELEAVVNDPEALWANWLRGTVKLPSGIGDVRKHQEHIAELENRLRARVKELEEDCKRLQGIAQKADEEICQILGKALGYPWFKDDPKNFPECTEADGVCVGDHCGATLALELVDRVNELEEKVDQLVEAGEALKSANSAADDDIRQHLQVANYNLHGLLNTGERIEPPNPPQTVHQAGIDESLQVREWLKHAYHKWNKAKGTK